MASLFRDWSALGERLDHWRPPQDPFEPTGAWTLQYARHALIPERDGTPGGALSGSLILQRLPAPAPLRFRATENVSAGFSSPTVTAEAVCAPDALLTPQRWSLSIRWRAGKQARLNPGEIDQTRSGHIDGGEIVVTGVKERRVPAPSNWTAFWHLFAAIPLLPFAPTAVLAFELFEEFELRKPEQRLVYAGPRTVDLNGHRLALHVFEQTGQGVLPWRWWLDDSHRVLLAAGDRRAYLIDATSKGDSP